MLPNPTIGIHITGRNDTGPSFNAVTQGLKELQAQLDSTKARLSPVTAAFAELGRSAETASTGVSALASAMRDLTGTFDRFQPNVDGFGAIKNAASLARVELAGLRAEMDAISRMPSGGFGGGIPNTVHGRPAGSSVGRAGQTLETGLAERVGLGGRVASAAFGPEGLAIGAALYGGFKSAQAAADYQSTIALTTAQAGLSPSMAPALSKSILDYTAGGKSPYSATTLAGSGGLEPLLAHGYSLSAIQQALPSISAVGAQNHARDLTDVDNMINTMASLTGAGPKATGAQLTSYADFLSRLESRTTIPPGQLTSALPRLLSGMTGTGVSAEQAGALLLKAGTANPSARLDATGLVRLVSDITTKPTKGARDEADRLGLPIGPGAIEQYGSIFGYLQAVQTATAGPNQRKLLSGMFTQTNALQTYYDVVGGGGLGQVAGYYGDLKGSKGAAQQAMGELSTGTTAQATQLMNRFNADLITVGSVLNDNVTPHLISFGNNLLNYGEKLGGGLGNLKGWMDQHVPGGAGTVLAAGAGPLGAAAAAAVGAFNHLHPGSPGGGEAHPPGSGHWETVSMGRSGSHRQWIPDAAAPGARSAAYAAFPVALPSGTDPSLNPANPALGGGNSFVTAAIRVGMGAGAAPAAALPYHDYQSRTSQETILGHQLAAMDLLNGVKAPRGGSGAGTAVGAIGAGLPALLAGALQGLPGHMAEAASLTAGGEVAGRGPDPAIARRAQEQIQAKMLQAAQQQVQAAGLFAQSVQIHHGSIQQQVQAVDKQYQADLHMASVQGLTGTALANARLSARNTRDAGLQGAYGSQLSLDQSHLALLMAQGGNVPTPLIDQILADEKATGVNQYQLQLDKQNMLGALPKTPPPQFVRPTAAGPGDLIAGYGSAAARAALPDRPRAAESQTIALLTQQLDFWKKKDARDMEEIELLKSQLRQTETLTSTAVKQFAWEQRAAASTGTATNTPPSRPGRRTPR